MLGVVFTRIDIYVYRVAVHSSKANRVWTPVSYLKAVLPAFFRQKKCYFFKWIAHNYFPSQSALKYLH